MRTNEIFAYFSEKTFVQLQFLFDLSFSPIKCFGGLRFCKFKFYSMSPKTSVIYQFPYKKKLQNRPCLAMHSWQLYCVFMQRGFGRDSTRKRDAFDEIIEFWCNRVRHTKLFCRPIKRIWKIPKYSLIFVYIIIQWHSIHAASYIYYELMTCLIFI